MASQLKPDLIVLDFAMPMLNGIQAAEEILEATPRVPIVLYTLHKLFADSVDFLEDAAVNFLCISASLSLAWSLGAFAQSRTVAVNCGRSSNGGQGWGRLYSMCFPCRINLSF
jgi:CheY-like chemotaxis protein